MTTYCPACLKPLSERDDACPSCGERPAAPCTDRDLLALSRPLGTAIEIWEATPDRRIFHLRRGRGGFFLFFAAAWLALTIFAASANLPGRRIGNNVLPNASFVALFWLAGLALMFTALRQRFLRTTVLLERERLLVERNLFGWKSVAETPLAEASMADLVVAYEENYKPVFAIRLGGVERKIQFGASLEIADKNWLVDQINGFLAGKLNPATPRNGPSHQQTPEAELKAQLVSAGLKVERPDEKTLHHSSVSAPAPNR
jgi:hypothetical protein